jgi:hypothetical protein
MKFELGATYDRSCDLSTITDEFPEIMGVFTDSDCENGANRYIRLVLENGVKSVHMYYICDYHLTQMQSGIQIIDLTEYDYHLTQMQSGIQIIDLTEYVQYAKNNPSASWNLPK